MNNTSKTVRLILCLIAGSLAWLFPACDAIYEFPDTGKNPQIIRDTTSLELNIAIDVEMKISSDSIFQTYATLLEGDYDVRYIVDIYLVNEQKPDEDNVRIKRIIKTESNMLTDTKYSLSETLVLPIRKYRLIAWVDFVDKGSQSDKYYRTDDLREVSIITNNDQYKGYSTTKDAYTEKIDMDLTPYLGLQSVKYTAELKLKRPFATYRIIATDVEKYMTYHQSSSYASIQPFSSLVAYNLFFPMGYNAFIYAPDNFKAGISYRYDVVGIVPEKEVIIASDFVFVGDNTFYLVDFEIFSAENKRINTVKGLKIPLERNKITIVRSEFLTGLNSGNVGISDNFDDEIIIRM